MQNLSPYELSITLCSLCSYQRISTGIGEPKKANKFILDIKISLGGNICSDKGVHYSTSLEIVRAKRYFIQIFFDTDDRHKLY